MIYFGKNVKYIRKVKNIKQKELTKMLGLKPGNIGNYERGDNFPAMPALINICKHFGIDPATMLLSDIEVSGSLERAHANAMRDFGNYRKSGRDAPRFPNITNNIMYLANSLDMTNIELSEQLHLGEYGFDHRILGKLDTLDMQVALAIVRYFDITLDDLIAGSLSDNSIADMPISKVEEKKTTYNIIPNEREKELTEIKIQSQQKEIDLLRQQLSIQKDRIDELKQHNKLLMESK